tara:strand:+ start:1860 stop:2705 length:846 start_codon:yes stop_codon:yes gene_type:complete
MIKKRFKKKDLFNKILIINIVIFMSHKLISLFDFLFNNNPNKFIQKWFALPAELSQIINKPWTLITYNFIHFDLFHLIFNMMFFYLGYRIFIKYLTSKQLICVYLLGGVFGGILYIISYNQFPVFELFINNSYMVGASASVLSIFIAISTYNPNYYLPFYTFGKIKLLHLSCFLIIMDLLLISTKNSGGHIAHIGGAIFGYLYIILLNKGIDISVNFDNFISHFSKKYKKNKRSYYSDDQNFRNKKNKKQEQINSILEKISKNGYDSLNDEEKNILFKESK